MKRLTLTFLLFCAPLLADIDHLILHFDVNGTIMAGDTVGKRKPEETLIQKLGEEVYGVWDHTQKEPTSYAEYVSHSRKGKKNALIKVMRKQNHPQTKEIEEAFKELKGTLSKGAVFPSFYRLLDHLDNKGIAYTVHLRTFGGDIKAIQSDCREKLGTPLFIKPISMSDNTFVNGGGKKLSLEEVYQTFCTENTASQEDWKRWKALKKRPGSGKLFPINVKDVGTLSIFFDDHIEPGDSPTNIVVPIDLEGNELEIDPLIASGKLCLVNTLEAIRDLDYFIKKVESAIASRESDLPFER